MPRLFCLMSKLIVKRSSPHPTNCYACSIHLGEAFSAELHCNYAKPKTDVNLDQCPVDGSIGQSLVGHNQHSCYCS